MNILNIRTPVYLDKASTKPLKFKWNVLLFWENMISFYNLSSLFPQSAEMQLEIKKVKNYFSEWLNAQNYSIIFTSGSTESINTALKGVCFVKYLKNSNIQKFNVVTSTIEHKAILETVKFLKKFGFEIRFIPISKTGTFDPDALNNLIDDKTILLSLSYANNETGIIQPIEIVPELKKRFNFCFHCDLTSSISYGPFDLQKYGIDLASFSAHKMFGLKGIGCLIIKKGLQVCPLIHGGGQQDNFRGGTENYSLIKVWGEYIKKKLRTYPYDQNKIKSLNQYCIKKIKILKKELGDRIIFNSLLSENRLPNIMNILITDIYNRDLIGFLSNKDIFVGMGAACNNLIYEDSYVLREMRLSQRNIESFLRISFDENNKFSDFDNLINGIRLFLSSIKGHKSLEIFEDNLELNLPDCETFRKIAWKYWFRQVRKLK